PLARHRDLHSFPTRRSSDLTRVFFQFEFMLSNGDKKLTSEKGSFVDSAFLQMFDYKVLAGDPTSALRNPSQIIITKSLVDRLFADRKSTRLNSSHVKISYAV